MDLAATFLDYGGVEVPAEMDSRSLRPVLEGATDSHREVVLSGLRDFRMAWDGRYKLVRGYRDQEVAAVGLAGGPGGVAEPGLLAAGPAAAPAGAVA